MWRYLRPQRLYLRLGEAGARPVELGQLGNDAVALGASTLVIEELLASGGRLPESRAGNLRRATL